MFLRPQTIAVIVVSVLAVVLTGCSSKNSQNTSSNKPKTTLSSDAISDAWVNSTDTSASPTMTGMFMTITNTTGQKITLTSAKSDAAGMVEIHEVVTENGQEIMRVKQGGISIKPGEKAQLLPGKDHIMLMDLKRKLSTGSEITVTLEFSNSSPVTVTAPVKKFTESMPHYHSSSASPSATMSMS